MPPIEAYFTINGIKMDGEIIAEDGEIAVLHTPVGKAMGRVEPSEDNKIRWLNRPLRNRFLSVFPGEKELSRDISKEENKDLVIREKTYRSQVGKVVIVFKATNSPNLYRHTSVSLLR